MKVCIYMTILFNLMILHSCGLPSSDDLEDLQVPMGLKAKVICSGTTPEGIEITFYGYNPENFFSGYNVYIVKSPYNAYDNVYYYVYSHKKIDSQNRPYFDNNIELAAVVQNENNLYPTITLNYLASNYPNYPQKPTQIKFNITKTPVNIDNGNFISGSTYAIGVTAISYSNTIETIVSNVVSIVYQCP
ncbi:MAG TPA: hypothetical protein PK663_04665 [Spirochaetota bacterium]|nr:hypothetical protein [Spirochaetota bacterium]